MGGCLPAQLGPQPYQGLGQITIELDRESVWIRPGFSGARGVVGPSGPRSLVGVVLELQRVPEKDLLFIR